MTDDSSINARTKNLIEKVLNKKHFVKWSVLLSGGSKSSLKSEIRSFLEVVSGYDIVPLIKDLCSDIEYEEIQENELKALKNIGDVYSSENGKYFKPNVKRNLVKNLKLSGITRKKAIKLGYI